MKNPWLNIKHDDYENHMIEAGQSQVLNDLTKYCLEKYQAEIFALLGCATGNGLEHIKTDVTKKVYAIDINREYLNKTREKFENKISDLELLELDIQNDELSFKNVDLFFVGLVLEFVDPQKVIRKIIKTIRNNGILFLVIQKNKLTSIISKTNYKSMETLVDISREVDLKEIDGFIRSENMALIRSDEIKITENKSFITIEYQREETQTHNTLV